MNRDDSAARLGTRAELVVPVSLGLLVGAGVLVQPTLAPVALLGLIAAWLGAAYPPLLVVGMWAGMLLDRVGMTSLKMGAFPITASKLTVLGSIGLWGLHCALTKATVVRWHPVLTAMLGVLASTAISIAWANGLENGKFTLYGLAMMTVLVALVFAVLAEVPLAPLYRVIGFGFALALLASLRHGSADRSAGTMGDPNEWATLVLLLTPLLLGGLADDEHPLAAGLRVSLLGLAPLAVLHSESRSALVVGFVVGPVCVYLLRARTAELVLCLVAAVVAAPFLLSLEALLTRFLALIENIQGGAVVQDASFEERSELFRQGKQLFFDHWFIGAGPGNFQTATGFVSHTGELRPAHDTYLEIASEQGIVGLIPTGLFIGTVAFTLWEAWRGATTVAHQNRVLGAAVSLGALALMAATLGLLTFSMAYLVLGFTLAVTYQALGSDQGEPLKRRVLPDASPRPPLPDAPESVHG